MGAILGVVYGPGIFSRNSFFSKKGKKIIQKHKEFENFVDPNRETEEEMLIKNTRTGKNRKTTEEKVEVLIKNTITGKTKKTTEGEWDKLLKVNPQQTKYIRIGKE